MKAQFEEDFNLKFELTEEEKKAMLTDFSNNFTQAHKLMAWIEDPNVPLNERTKYFNSMWFIFSSMTHMLKMFVDAGLTEKQIIEALNDLPF